MPSKLGYVQKTVQKLTKNLLDVITMRLAAVFSLPSVAPNNINS